MTVLVPTTGASDAAHRPRIRWDAAGAPVGADVVHFKPGEAGWTFGGVNDESAAKVPAAKERSLVPFRK